LAVAITRQIADALIYAHQAGLVHRDIKPANVLLTDDEWGGLRVKLTDFGIAKAGSGLGGDLTRTGTVLGTPKYLSPEQIRGQHPDARADLYSVGIVLFEMLTGAPPFVGANDMATALAHLNDRVPRVSTRAREVPAALERLVTDLLAKDPQRRVQSASALRQRLDACDVSPSPGGPAGRRAGRRQREATLALIPHLPPIPVGGTRTSVTPMTPPGPAFPPPVVPAPGSDAATRRNVRAGTEAARGGAVAAPAGAARPDSGTEVVATPPARRARPRRTRAPGLVVLGLVLAGAVVAGVLFEAHRGHRTPSPGAGSSEQAAVVRIAGVAPFMIRGTPDDPQGLPNTFDGNPATYWHTDQYHSATFSNLYPGLGLAVHLSGSATLHRLTVTSSTVGWAAQTYTSTTSVPSGQPVTAWGQPTDTRTDIDGSTTFTLGGRHGDWVLLWLTNLGPSFQTRINELAVS
jgi:hypothetical protein